MAVIAVVDDDEGVRLALGDFLRSLGHRAELFTSGEALLAWPLLDGCACLISDLQMGPGLDGLQLAREAARRPAGPRVILIPALADAAVRAAARAAGVHAVLPKPFDAERLALAVEAALHGDPA